MRTISDLAAVDREALENLIDFVNTGETSERIHAVMAATRGEL